MLTRTTCALMVAFLAAGCMPGAAADPQAGDRQVADLDRPLQGPKWVVISQVLATGAATRAPAEPGIEAFARFSPDGALTGNTGCNSFSGRATIQGSAVTITDLTMTKRGCDGVRGALENVFLAHFNGPLSAQIKAAELTLTRPDGTGLVFREHQE